VVVVWGGGIFRYQNTCDRFDEADPENAQFLREHGEDGVKAVREAKDILDPLADVANKTVFLCSEAHVKLHDMWCQVQQDSEAR